MNVRGLKWKRVGRVGRAGGGKMIGTWQPLSFPAFGYWWEFVQPNASRKASLGSSEVPK